MKTMMKLFVAALIAATPAKINLDVDVDFGVTSCEFAVRESKVSAND
jgi:hypothetical protein